MPDWLRTTVWIVGVLALLLTLVIGYLMWRYRIPPCVPQLMVDPGTCLGGMGRSAARA